ncbi:hypothetical protein [Silvimonas soli]|uniref:hypothetical protein n=1 Tax=Silvimonas soli TaxID=2980100 RepID=UPI0024B33BBC|nr:hypothetical protein [Silvimonas soli]
MPWAQWIACFFGGVFFTNAVPHLVRGVTGQPFQTPFAKPSGKGLSSSSVNVVWGWFNLVLAYALLFRAGDFDIHASGHVAAFGLGILLMGLMSAHLFGPLHGGSRPQQPGATG